MQLFKNFGPVGVVVIMALLVLGGISFFYNQSVDVEKTETAKISIGNLLAPRAAYAKEIVDKSIRNVEGVTVEIVDGRRIVKKQNGDVMPFNQAGIGYAFTKESILASLQEAEQSNDLIYLGDKVKDGGRTRVLQFTDKQENTTILAVNEDNMPIIRFSYNKNKGAASGGVVFERGNGTNPSQESQMQNGEGGVNYGSIDPNAPRPDFEQMLKEWTENLEQPKDFQGVSK